MSPAALLIIVVAARDVDEAATAALWATAAETLREYGSVQLLTAEVKSAEDFTRVEARLTAAAVASISWRDAARTQAQLRVHVRERDQWRGQWIDREVTFSPADTPSERGRTLGLALTSMLLTNAPEVVRSPPPHSAPPVFDDSVFFRNAIAGLFIGGLGLVGDDETLGAAVDYQRFLRADLSACVGAGARGGDLDQFRGNSLTMMAALGAAFWPLPPGRQRHLAVGGRVEALALYSRFTRPTATGQTEAHSRFQPGLRVTADVSWRLISSVDAVVSVGLEAVPGATNLEVRDRVVEAVPWLRGVANAGLQLRF